MGGPSCLHRIAGSDALGHYRIGSGGDDGRQGKQEPDGKTGQVDGGKGQRAQLADPEGVE